MKKKIKIEFCDWWSGFDKTDNYFYNLLKDEFEVEISNNPDYLFFSVFGSQHQSYKCKKIFYTGENVDIHPDSDYSFTFDETTHNNYQLKHYLLYDGFYDLNRPKIIEESMAKRKFCSFVVSNGNCKLRNEFFLKLSKYKGVDSGGRHWNNIGFLVNDKLDFLKKYKFNICFENDAYRGYNEYYTTEKLIQAMQSNTIGIYYGNTKIESEFNKNSFLNIRDYSSIDEAIEYIIYLDNNDEKYLEILNQPCFTDYKIPDNNKIENIKSFLYKIFSREI